MTTDKHTSRSISITRRLGAVGIATAALALGTGIAFATTGSPATDSVDNSTPVPVSIAQSTQAPETVDITSSQPAPEPETTVPVEVVSSESSAAGEPVAPTEPAQPTQQVPAPSTPAEAAPVESAPEVVVPSENSPSTPVNAPPAGKQVLDGVPTGNGFENIPFRPTNPNDWTNFCNVPLTTPSYIGDGYELYDMPYSSGTQVIVTPGQANRVLFYGDTMVTC